MPLNNAIMQVIQLIVPPKWRTLLQVFPGGEKMTMNLSLPIRQQRRCKERLPELGEKYRSSVHISIFLMCTTRELNFSFFGGGGARTACGILASRPGWSPGPRQWKDTVLTTGPPENSQEGIELDRLHDPVSSDSLRTWSQQNNNFNQYLETKEGLKE